MKVSVLTSLYKGSQYLASFMEDILNQTIFEQCEWFILDAASPDNEYSILQPYIEQYSNIRYERLNQDPGIYSCWNYMVKNSDSEYITNANVDDRLFPTCIEEHIQLLDINKNIDVAYCYNAISNQANITYNDITDNGVFSCDIELFPTDHYSLRSLLACNLPHSHPVWRRSLHDRFGYFNGEEYVSGGDWEFFLRCGVNDIQMQLIPKVLGIYYKNPEGMSTKKENMKRNLKEVYDIRTKYTNLLQQGS